jgi:hypothetical protein
LRDKQNIDGYVAKKNANPFGLASKKHNHENNITAFSAGQPFSRRSGMSGAVTQDIYIENQISYQTIVLLSPS